jgi:hypothetical protein
MRRDSDTFFTCACPRCGYNIWISEESFNRVGMPKCPVDAIPLEWYHEDDDRSPAKRCRPQDETKDWRS